MYSDQEYNDRYNVPNETDETYSSSEYSSEDETAQEDEDSEQNYSERELPEKTYSQLEEENERLAAANRSLKVTSIVAAILLLLAVGYMVYSEIKQPLFGKWVRIAQENQKMAAQADTLNLIKVKMDSVMQANNLLTENIETTDGVFFEVQIGAFQSFNLDQYMEDLAKLRKDVDGMDKYTLGKFREYKKAKQFKEDIQKMGISDAFIVGKINGQRASNIEEAIQATTTNASF
jgi:hypothetical protein